MENINIAVMIGEKFQCETCNIICSTKSNLNKHVKQVHLKLKEYKCDDLSNYQDEILSILLDKNLYQTLKTNEQKTKSTAQI